MAKREKKRKSVKFDHEEEAKPSKSVIVLGTGTSDDDDNEANEDLSLKIVEKAKLRASTTSRKTGASVETKDPEVIDLTLCSSPEPEDVPYLKDTKKKKEKKEKKKKKNKKIETQEEAVDVANEGEKAETSKADEFDKLLETNPVELSDNMVLRKLLRGPRYFDPPDSSWGMCYNCGEEGHKTANCTSARRKKPCFVCGSLEHMGKQCTKGRDCFICKKGGHRAKDCPEKYRSGSQNYQLCLKCGDSGHDMFMCKDDYSHDDLKEIQCYICKSFGHLCCAKLIDSGPREVSCYRCGQLGHTGLGCTGSRGEATGVPSSCYKCGEEGHFARECASPAKVYGRANAETTGTPISCYKCGGGHFARECPSSANVLSGGTPSSCYKCGEDGHFARECSNSANVFPGGPLSSCYKCGEEGHFARECPGSAKVRKRSYDLTTPTRRFHKENNNHVGARSVPHDLGKASKRMKPHNEGGFTMPPKSKQRGGWITEDPGDYSRRIPKSSGWRSPATPTNYWNNNPVYHTNGYASSSPPFQNTRRLHYDTPAFNGSANMYQHRYSASRFGDYSSDGMWRNYN